MNFIQENLFFFLLFGIIGFYLGHLADFFALAWHQENKVFSRKQFPIFFQQQISTKNPLWIFCGRKRDWITIILETGFCSVMTMTFFCIFGLSAKFMLMTFLMFSFMVALLSDISWREIPHEINYAIICVSLLNLLYGNNSIINFLLGFIPALLLVATGVILYFIRPQKGFGMGGGDIRFILSTGLLMGISFSTILLCLGSFIAIIMNLFYFFQNAAKGASTYIPMMPGFSIAYLIMLFSHYLMAPANDLMPVLGLFTTI